MNSLPVIRYELKRIVFSRKYLYLLLLVSLSIYDVLTRLLVDGMYGTEPYSRLTYAHFLSLTSPMLLATLVLLCAAVFSEQEMAARKILFSAPISSATYYAIKGTAIAAAFLIVATLTVVASFGFYAWHYRYFQFGTLLQPILFFLVPSAVFIFGLSMAAGRFSVKLLYGLIPVILFLGMFNFGLPVWVDICGNNFLTGYVRMLIVSRGSAEIVYYLPTSFLLSRSLMVAAGILLFVLSCRRLRRV